MKKLLLPFVLLVLPLSAVANVRLPDVIGSSMVLQQKDWVIIWGWADPGESVTVSLARRKLTVVADASGKWRVALGKLFANATPQTMTIAGKNTPIMETGLANLTKNETRVLVHFADGQTQQWLMLHVENPQSGAKQKGT